MNIIENALNLAYSSHKGQFRKGNNLSPVKLPYICHPIDVVNLLYKWGVKDENMIAAAFLHDVLEDTETTAQQIIDCTNNVVSYYVENLTHDPKLSKQEYVDSFETKPIEIFLIKLADRICNVKDFTISSPKYALEYAKKASKLYYRIFYMQQTLPDIIMKYAPNISKDLNLQFFDPFPSLDLSNCNTSGDQNSVLCIDQKSNN